MTRRGASGLLSDVSKTVISPSPKKLQWLYDTLESMSTKDQTDVLRVAFDGTFWTEKVDVLDALRLTQKLGTVATNPNTESPG